MTIRWFLSGKVRHAFEMRRHVRRILKAQQDILTPAAVEAINAALTEVKKAIDSNADNKTLDKHLEELEKAANKFLKPYPNSGWRENIEVLLVAIAVAMAVRTFFLQPFKIPTGSMQPTLYGITTLNLKEHPEITVPGFGGRFFDAVVRGTFYHRLVAREDGQVEKVEPPEHFFRFINKQTIVLNYNGSGRKRETLWFTPDEKFEQRAGLHDGQTFRKGEDILKLKETTGDHLFVNRVAYNFRRPERGEIVVFETKGIHHYVMGIDYMRQDQFYIKRLVGLGGERISIGEDRHVRINGQQLDASTPHFENIYSFPPDSMPQDSHYSGHTPIGYLAEKREFPIPPKHYFVLGDNTVSSSDSRYWGYFPEKNIVGKPAFIYWPISSRFGWGYR